jgi:hypothetical protein
MEDRQDLINLLLDGLEAHEREHVKTAVREMLSQQLDHPRDVGSSERQDP